MSDGWLPTGGEPLQFKYATGFRPNTRLLPMQVSIHAPPRFSEGLNNQTFD